MENNIKCPACGHEFQVEDAFFNQAEEKIKKDYEKKFSQQAAIFYKKTEALEKEKEEFEKKKEKENELFKERLDKKIEEEKVKLQKSTAEEFELKIKELQSENEKRKAENKELKEKELSILKREAQLKEKQEEMELEFQKKMLEKRDEIAAEVRKTEHEKNELKFKDFEKKFEDQKKLIEEMQRKAEQGSMQLQGEVLELAIEEWLAAQFPLDTIEEIKKGARGGDCIQIVNTRTHQNCGTIYYESKRTKDFQAGWIDKFKNDIREKSANVGVIVTEAMPNDMERMGLKDGIWICSYEEFKGLCTVLRESIIQISNAVSSQENRGDKMHMLYDYLTSNTFRLQVEAIVDGFTQMRIDLDSEKRAMQSIWKKREKQIEKVTINTIDMHSSIKGIAGNAIQAVKLMELPEINQEEE
ncbi:MAG: DUF2130 domain-containing protein [Bacteroidota bacterium]